MRTFNYVSHLYKFSIFSPFHKGWRPRTSTFLGFINHRMSHGLGSCSSDMGPFEPKNFTTPHNKNTSYVQLYTMPLAIYLITVGLGTFIDLQCGVPNPPSKPLFQPDMDMTSTEAHMSLSLTNTSPPPKDLSGLLINNQTNN